MKTIKIILGIVLGTLLGLVTIFFLLECLLMFFGLALRGVYSSETTGMLLAFLAGATLTKRTFQSAFRKKMPQRSSPVPGDAGVTVETTSALARQASHPTFWLVGLILLGGLCFGGIGAGYGAFLHLHPAYKEKVIERTLNLPHPDNYE